MNIFTFICLLILSLPWLACAENWYVSPTASGAGTLADPGSLNTAIAHTGWAASIVGGDTVWLRSGTYTNGTNIALMGFSGTAGNLVTWRNYSGERPIWNFPLRFTTRDYHRFQGIEFIDTSKAIREEAIGYFDSTSSTNFEWINLIIHDLPGVWTGGSGGQSVRGCVIWNAGQDTRDHITYPYCRSFAGNIVGWTSGDAIELGTAGMRVQSNAFWGAGLTEGEGATAVLMTLGSNSVITDNSIYEELGNSRGVTIQDLPPSSPVFTNNIVHAQDPMRIFSEWGGFNFSGNMIHVFGGGYVMQRSDNAGSWTVDNNGYFSTATVMFVDESTPKTFATWKMDNAGYDAASVSTNSAYPPDVVRVFRNADDASRAHIIVWNWSNADNVAVNLSGVLSAGITYSLISAQHYNAGAIQSGVFNGTSISVPMTNLSVAPVLYGLDMIQPTSTSPQFAAFVVIMAGVSSKISGATIRAGGLQ